MIAMVMAGWTLGSSLVGQRTNVVQWFPLVGLVKGTRTCVEEQRNKDMETSCLFH